MEVLVGFCTVKACTRKCMGGIWGMATNSVEVRYILGEGGVLVAVEVYSVMIYAEVQETERRR